MGSELDTNDLSKLLRAWSAGDQSALNDLTPIVYDELRRLAHRYMDRERPGHILQTTALVYRLRHILSRATEQDNALRDRVRSQAGSTYVFREGETRQTPMSRCPTYAVDKNIGPIRVIRGLGHSRDGRGWCARIFEYCSRSIGARNSKPSISNVHAAPSLP